MRSLGPAFAAPGPTRGHLALASDGDAIIVLLRRGSVPCTASDDRNCAAFSLQRVSGDQTQPLGLPMIVPEPCPDHSTLLAVERSRLHYAICSLQNGVASTTVFSIDRAPEYASADRVLPACTPLTFSVHGASAVLVADCQGRKSSVRVDAHIGAATPLGPAQTACHGDGTELSLDAGRIRLERPAAELEALLPDPLASRTARAAFSGGALLVATATGDRLTVVRHACVAGLFSAERVERAARRTKRGDTETP